MLSLSLTPNHYQQIFQLMALFNSRKAYKKIETEKEHLEEQLQDLQQKYQHLEQKNKQLQQGNENLEVELAATIKIQASLKLESAAAEKVIQLARKENNQLKQQNNQSTRNIQGLERQVQDLLTTNCTLHRQLGQGQQQQVLLQQRHTYLLGLLLRKPLEYRKKSPNVHKKPSLKTVQIETPKEKSMPPKEVARVKIRADAQNRPVNMGRRMIAPRMRRRK